ncbi:MAG: hypothetical protein JXR55_10075 [Candidatus Fermentibacteraceae bacterium]|nr:hypothetical protein [Candidatus Fermentibacteraceae bacterium]
MYVRTVSRTNKDGSRVHYVQIVQKYWDPDKKKARTKVVCSLGRAGVEGDKHLRELVASIRKRLSLEELAGLDGWQFEDSWEHGAFHAVSELWEQLGLRGILELAVKDENRSVPFERAVFARETWRTIRNTLRTQKIGQLFTPSGRIYQASNPSHEVCKLNKLLQIEAPKQVLSVE